jgi:hypothetical protein
MSSTSHLKGHRFSGTFGGMAADAAGQAVALKKGKQDAVN